MQSTVNFIDEETRSQSRRKEKVFGTNAVPSKFICCRLRSEEVGVVSKDVEIIHFFPVTNGYTIDVKPRRSKLCKTVFKDC